VDTLRGGGEDPVEGNGKEKEPFQGTMHPVCGGEKYE